MSHLVYINLFMILLCWELRLLLFWLLIIDWWFCNMKLNRCIILLFDCGDFDNGLQFPWMCVFCVFLCKFDFSFVVVWFWLPLLSLICLHCRFYWIGWYIFSFWLDKEEKNFIYPFVSLISFPTHVLSVMSYLRFFNMNSDCHFDQHPSFVSKSRFKSD